jgi:hypothetical protein
VLLSHKDILSSEVSCLRGRSTATATLLRTTEAYLWPDVLDDPRTTSASRAELVMLYPHRGAVQKDLWMQLIEAAEARIDVLVCAGLFLPDGHPELAKVLVSKAEQGGPRSASRSAIPTPRLCVCGVRRSTSARGWRLGYG